MSYPLNIVIRCNPSNRILDTCSVLSIPGWYELITIARYFTNNYCPPLLRQSGPCNWTYHTSSLNKQLRMTQWLPFEQGPLFNIAHITDNTLCYVQCCYNYDEPHPSLYVICSPFPRILTWEDDLSLDYSIDLVPWPWPGALAMSKTGGEVEGKKLVCRMHKCIEKHSDDIVAVCVAL